MPATNWIKIDVYIFQNPKIRKAIRLVAGKTRQPYAKARVVTTFLELLTFCGRHRTDGFVSDDAVRTIGAIRSVVDHLVAAKLLNRHANGYLVHDYADWQQTNGANSRGLLSPPESVENLWKTKSFRGSAYAVRTQCVRNTPKSTNKNATRRR